MKPAPWNHLDVYRIKDGPFATNSGDNWGAFFIPFSKILGAPRLKVIASDGRLESEYPWDHVSVSLPNRCPTWEEMDCVKNIFWDESELVQQFHMPKAKNINIHPFCLHLWRPVNFPVKTPPSIMVGPSK